MKKLQTLQNDMIRIIKGYRRSDHVNMKDTRQSMNMMSINQLSCYHILLEVQKIMFRNSSEQLKNKLVQVQESGYALRSQSRGDLVIAQKPSRGCAGFTYFGPKLYNRLPKEMRDTRESGPFKRKMKKWVKDNIPE